MPNKTEYSEDFTRYLKDERFIEWVLRPNDEINKYWDDYLHKNQGELRNIELAKHHFKSVKLGYHQYASEKRNESMQLLKRSAEAYKRRKNIRHLAYGVAACAIIFILSLSYFYNNTRHETPLFEATNFIIGSELESENIILVTGNTSTVFDSNVNISINNDQSVSIKSEDRETENITIDQNTSNKLIVPYGKRSQVNLPDGTRVWLNSGSSLEFPSVFADEKREVYLNGEMYIEVAPINSRPFYVHTPDYQVRVYGTAFNVSTYNDSQSSVVLVEGSIALHSSQDKELFLTPNEQAIYSQTTGKFETRTVDPIFLTSWKEGFLTFDDTPISEVLKQIGRYYNISFNLGENVSFQGLTCTGKIILSDNIDNVMMALALISAMEYKVEDNLIYISIKNN